MLDLGTRHIVRKIWQRAIPSLKYVLESQIRVCRACERRTVVVAIGDGEEFQVCIRCRANLRYEMLAEYLRTRYRNIVGLDVLELDPDSPLRATLSAARTYTRSFYRDHVLPGTALRNGAVFQDITRLTIPDRSLDLIVSSDVLEHVPDAAAAFRESARVLRSGGAHVFTVPPRPATLCRASVENGRRTFLVNPPEYHLDPLDDSGILVYWEYGPDLATAFSIPGLAFNVVRGPEGTSRRIVWEARRI
jgi:SAM-dependent methyltransferase